MEWRSWTSDEMEESYKCMLRPFKTSFNCILTKKTKKGFLTILNLQLSGKNYSSAGYTDSHACTTACNYQYYSVYWVETN